MTLRPIRTSAAFDEVQASQMFSDKPCDATTRSRLQQRRAFLCASTSSLLGLPAANFLAPSVNASGNASTGSPEGVGFGKAKSVILFFLCGGASHIDMWDLKPEAPADYRGPFQPIATSASGIQISEHLPATAKQMHHLAIVRSVSGSVNTNDHHAGYYYQLTGHVPDSTFLSQGNDRRPYPEDWPFMGSVVGSRRSLHPSLPNALTLPHKPSKAPYTRPGQFAARMGPAYDPLYIQGNQDLPLQFQAPSLTLYGDVTADHLQSRLHLLEKLDQARKEFEGGLAPKSWKLHQERTSQLLTASSTMAAFDVASEPEALRDRYGKTVNAMSLLLARRLVEAEVPFITVFWKENEAFADKCKSAGGWDTHGNNFVCLKEHLLPEFDQAFAALIEDLHQKGLLEQTLVLVTSEMGRKPKIGDPRSGGPSGAGRDHWTHCMSVVMAGGGIRGGQVFGSTDRFAEYPSDHPVTPADIAKTVYHASGVKDLYEKDAQGRPYHLLEEGRPISHLF